MIKPVIKTQAQPAINTNKTSSRPFKPVISNPKIAGVVSKTVFIFAYDNTFQPSEVHR